MESKLNDERVKRLEIMDRKKVEIRKNLNKVKEKGETKEEIKVKYSILGVAVFHFG